MFFSSDPISIKKGVVFPIQSIENLAWKEEENGDITVFIYHLDEAERHYVLKTPEEKAYFMKQIRFFTVK